MVFGGLNSKAIAAFSVAAVAAAALMASPAIARKSKAPPPEPEPTLSGQAALAVISIKDQRIALYDSAGNVVRARISSGKTGYETPVGVFSILQKKVEHYSNLYDDAAMPHMQRLTWSGIALHAGVLPGYPASHGCVRLPPKFARQIFPMTRLGLRVVLTRDDIAPVDFEHRLLPVPEPLGEVAVATPAAYSPERETDVDAERATVFHPDVRNWPARQQLLERLREEAKAASDDAKVAVAAWEAEKAALKKYKREVALVAKREKAAEAKRKTEAALAKTEKAVAAARDERARKRAGKARDRAAAAVASADAKLAAATEAAAEADKIVGPINAAIAEAEAAKIAAVAASAEARRRTMPVSVFVSAKSQKLYVRQGNEPVFEAKVAVAGAGVKPIGTHVFTALDYAGDGDGVKWSVVTISQRTAGLAADGARPSRDRKPKDTASYAPPITDAAAAAAALERVTIPDDVRARISEYVWPRSSLIISDEDVYKETGKGTDFVVVASNEPQGALKIRKRQPPPATFRSYYDDGFYYSGRPPADYRNQRRNAPRYKGPFGWW